MSALAGNHEASVFFGPCGNGARAAGNLGAHDSANGGRGSGVAPATASSARPTLAV